VVNQFKDSTDGVISRPVPLFGSTWMALYYFLRSRLAGQDGEAQAGQSRREEPAEGDH
jgi:hypothetical protein